MRRLHLSPFSILNSQFSIRLSRLLPSALCPLLSAFLLSSCVYWTPISHTPSAHTSAAVSARLVVARASRHALASPGEPAAARPPCAKSPDRSRAFRPVDGGAVGF